MRWRYPLILVVSAFVVFIAGVGYGVVMIGVPTQDPTPAVAAAEARNIRISVWAMSIGACLLLASLLWVAVIVIGKRLKRPAAG